MPERFLVILPTYNESQNLPRIVPPILAQDPRLEILVVDDASPDGTGRLANDLAGVNLRVHVLHRTQKEGLGRAYLAGFTWALARDFDLMFEMDADFSHDPKFLVDMIAASRNADLVVGSRYKTGVNVINWPMSRLLLSYGANLYARWITGLPLTMPPAASSASGKRCWPRFRWKRSDPTAMPSR